MGKRSEWKKKARLDGKTIGTLVLSKEPHIGSKIVIPTIKDSNNHSVHIEIIEIKDEFVLLKRR